MHAAFFSDRTFEHPCRQRCIAQRVAGVDVFLDPVGHLQPVRCLPRFKRTDVPAEAPAHGEVDVARIVGDSIEVDGDVVESVAEDRPQELALWIRRFAQRLHLLDRILFFQDAGDDVGSLGAASDVFTGGEIEALNLLADFLVEARAALLAQRAFFHQLRQHCRRLVDGSEGIVRQVVLHGLDHMAHGVQADHVRRAEGARLGAAQLGARQVIDDVHGQAEFLGFVHDGQDTEHANAVGDEVRRILGAHDALAQGGGQKAFQLVGDLRAGELGRDDLDQVHIARRIEEVHAAVARFQVGVEAFGQLGDRQAGSVRGEDRVRADVRCDLLIQVVFPVHALGDGFDDQVATGQQVQVVFVVGYLDQRCIILVAQRRRRQFFQVLDGAQHDAILRAFLRWQVEQHDRHFRVDAMGGDLRAHHAGAEDGYFFNDEIGHIFLKS